VNGPQSPSPGGGSAVHALSSKDLLRGHSTVTIAHNGSLYRLQATRQGKLILTK
jgi:hemin uptake protein HemP